MDPLKRLPVLAAACALRLASAHAAPLPPALVVLDEPAFRSAVRPVLQRAGCASPSCHGSGLIAMRLSPAGNDARDLAEVLKFVVPGHPGRSALIEKPLGRGHLGGKNLSDGGCAEKLLASWIRGGLSLVPCPVEAPAIGAPVEWPAWLRDRVSSCATPACHGGPAAPRLVDPARTGGTRVDLEALAPSLDRHSPTQSRLLDRLLGGNGHPRALSSTDDPAARELVAWIAGVPPPGEGAPSFSVYARAVQPILERRGCMSGGCHGSGGSSLLLLRGGAQALANYVRLLPRIAAGLFPQKPENRLPHGGGGQLGGVDDCAASTIAAWIAGSGATGAPRCREHALPDRARFAALVQSSLEALTCPRCHGEGKLPFVFVAHPDAGALERNYREVLAHVNLDYPPASAVLLRVNEDCMQARIMAWVGSKPDPGCTVELKNFRGRFPSMAP